MGRSGDAGAYGLHLRGISPSNLTIEPSPDWPAVDVRQQPLATDGASVLVTPDTADIALIEGGWLHMARDDMTATFSVRAPLSEDDLLHPYLAAAAAWFAHWLGRDTFHGGAVAFGGRAFGIVGDKEAGKSTLLAWFAARGTDVLADDLLMLHEQVLFTGPRCIDLRAETVAVLASTEGTAVRGGSRHRLVLPQTRGAWPFAGWILLGWGPETAMNPVAARDRLPRLAPHRVLRVPPTSPGHLLRLAALPMWELTRPKSWDAMDEVLELVSTTLAGGS